MTARQRVVTEPYGAYALVAIWAGLVRLLHWLIDGQAAYYFPDSWNYVVLPSGGQGPHSLHGPFVYWVWDALLVGMPREMSVVALQNLFGIGAAVMVLAILRDLAGPRTAIIVALGYASVPALAFFDRTILTESVVVFLTTVLLFVTWRIQRTTSFPWLVGLVAVVGLTSGAMLSIRPNTRFGVVPVVLVVLIGLVRSQRRKLLGGNSARWAGLGRLAVLITVGIALALPSPIALMRHNDAQFGTFALTPATGSVLVDRWAFLIPCTSGEDVHPGAAAALAEVCGSPRGRNNRTHHLWSGGALSATLEPQPGFAQIQADLTSAATDALRASPQFAINDTLRNAWYLIGARRLNLEQYDNGAVYFTSERRIANFARRDTWFSGATARAPLEGETHLMSLVRSTAKMPGLLFIGLVVAAPAAAWRRRSFLRQDGVERPTVAALLDVPVLFTLMCLSTCLVTVGVTSAGGGPVFRYWIPLLPVLAVGLGSATGVLLGRGSLPVDALIDPAAANDEGVDDPAPLDIATTGERT